MKVFLTGGTGFIGRHLALALAAAGRRVLCLVRDPAKAEWMRSHPGLEAVAGDLDDEDLLRRCAGRAGIVYHLAGCTRALRRPEFFRVNGEGTGRVAAAAAAAPSRPKVVYVSSLAAAGPATAAQPAGEKSPPRPVTAYGESKLLGERLLGERLAGGRWTVVRPPAVYGPWDRDVLFLFRLASRGLLLRVAGPAREVSIIHVDDLVRALLLAGESPRADGRVYHVSDGKAHGPGDLARAFRGAFGRRLLELPVPAPLLGAAGLAGDALGLLTGRPPVLGADKAREAAQCGWVCDGSAIGRDLGFAPAVGLDEGFRATLEWYRRAGWL